ncbi:hypothetical protein MRX96_031450 [Rhipicephalus microplus]
MLAPVLLSRCGVIKVRVNSGRNIMAADMSSRESLEKLSRSSVAFVSTQIPADQGYSTKYLHGVEGDLADHELLQCIESSVPGVSAVRFGNADTLLFAGPVPPEHVSLFKLRCRVRPSC